MKMTGYKCLVVFSFVTCACSISVHCNGCGLNKAELHRPGLGSCCSPGYLYVREEDCVCGSAQDNLQIPRCDDNNTRAYIRGGTWVGYVSSTDYPGECTGSNTSFYVGTCPNGYCVNEGLDQLLLPHNRSKEELDRLICGKTRTGILCGKCRGGFGPGVNLFLAPCVDCKNDPLSQYGWLLWIFLEFVPLCVMLFVVLYFNIDFLSGPFISYWFYAQVINASFPISTTGPIDISNDPISILERLLFIIFFGIFNLQFFSFLFPPFCLSASGSNMEVLDIMAFKSTTRIFALVVIGIILLYHKCKGGAYLHHKNAQNRKQTLCHCTCNWLLQRFSFSSALHGLAAFFILVYSRFLSYCGNIFGRSGIIFSDPKAPSIEVVRLQGNLMYFDDTKHIIYSTFTLLFILFIILPPVILLLLYPSLHQIQQLAINSRYKVLKWVFKYKVFGMFNTPRVQLFADLFQSSYKYRYRFFAGILLLARIGILMVWNLVGSRAAGFAVLSALCLFILTLHSCLQPNIKNWINVLDTMIYSHMTAITLLAVYISSNSVDPNLKSLNLLYLVLIYLPAIYPILYLSRKFYYRIRACRNKSISCYKRQDDDESGANNPRHPIAGSPGDRHNDGSLHNSLQDSTYIDIDQHQELWWST